MAQSNLEIQKLCKNIIILGFIIDGKISNSEKQKIKTLENFGILDLNVNEIIALSNKFKNGYPIEL